jgi:hypothetical protein
MSLYLRLQFLKVLNDGTVDGASEVGVVISDDAGLVSDFVENILERMSDVLISRSDNLSHLKAAFAQELVSSSERDLNDASELCEFLAGVVLDVGDALGKRCEQDGSKKKGRNIPRSRQ